MQKAKELDHKEVKQKLFKAFIDVNKECQDHTLGISLNQHQLIRLLDNSLKLKLNSRLRSRAAKIKYNAKFEKMFIQKNSKKVILIEVNPELTVDRLQGVLKHEALHFISNLGDTKEFQAICDMLSIPKYHDQLFKKAERFKYKILCKSCNNTYKRKRKTKIVKNIENYRCGKCQGDLKVKKIN